MEAKDLVMEAMKEEAETSWASESGGGQIFRNIQQHTQYEEWNIHVHITKMIRDVAQ